MTADAPALPQSSALAARLVWRAESESTNTELVREAGADPAQWPHFSVLLTDTQLSGRARLDRTWASAPGSGLAISVLIRPQFPVESYGWIALLAGIAMTEAVAAVLAESGLEPERAALKWPNDVLVDGKKICGTLAEITGERAVVIGAGLNTEMSAEQLPVAHATSLAVLGARVTPDAIVSLYLSRFRELYDGLVAAGGDAVASGLAARVTARCDTLGRDVRVEMPAGRTLLGRAEGIDPGGRLIVRDATSGESAPIAAGDITHLRFPTPGA